MISRNALAAALSGLLLTATAHGLARAAEGRLRIVAVDVEGGAATLYVTPEGKSLLIDTGWPTGMGGVHPGAPGPTSADRIAAAARALGVNRIDYLLITHYHVDHVGGLKNLMAKLPIGAVIDHGPNRERLAPGARPQDNPASPEALYPQYTALIAGHRRISVKPGEELQIGSLKLTVLASDGQVIRGPLPGAGRPNPACAGVGQVAENGGEENVRSVASLIRFGKVRIAAYGDLTWNMEARLACPVDKVGPVDVLIVTHHGADLSSNPAEVRALDPVVAIMGNGSTKGGDPNAIGTLAHLPELRGFWRLHGSAKHPELDGPEPYVANLSDDPDTGYPIELSISRKGEIRVVNERNGFSQTYRARGR